MTQIIDNPTTPSWQAPQPAPEPAAKPRRTWKTWHLATAVVVTLFAGAGMGSAGKGPDSKAAAATTAVTPAAPPVVKTVTETKIVAPAECAKALDAAQKVIGIAADLSGHVGEYFNRLAAAADTGDVSLFFSKTTTASQTLSSQTRSATAQVTAVMPDFQTNALACRAAN